MRHRTVVLRKGTSHSISCLQNLHRTIALISPGICARYLFLSSRQENAEMQKLKQVCISMGLHGKRCVCRIQRFVVVARSLSKWYKVTTNTRIRKTNETRQARRQRHLARSREPRGRRPEEHEMKAIRNDILYSEHENTLRVFALSEHRPQATDGSTGSVRRVSSWYKVNVL